MTRLEERAIRVAASARDGRRAQAVIKVISDSMTDSR